MNMPTDPAKTGADMPGDTCAPDIVSPTGEEMPVASHDEIGDQPEDTPQAQRPDATAPPAETTDAVGEGPRDLRTYPAGGSAQRTWP
jgi:hypothetical protein